MAKKSEPPKPISWKSTRFAKGAIWLGTVEVPDKPIEKGTLYQLAYCCAPDPEAADPGRCLDGFRRLA
jgi:hypothetical protein